MTEPYDALPLSHAPLLAHVLIEHADRQGTGVPLGTGDEGGHHLGLVGVAISDRVIWSMYAWYWPSINVYFSIYLQINVSILHL